MEALLALPLLLFCCGMGVQAYLKTRVDHIVENASLEALRSFRYIKLSGTQPLLSMTNVPGSFNETFVRNCVDTQLVANECVHAVIQWRVRRLVERSFGSQWVSVSSVKSEFTDVNYKDYSVTLDYSLTHWLFSGTSLLPGSPRNRSIVVKGRRAGCGGTTSSYKCA